jgi:hypothetical protein
MSLSTYHRFANRPRLESELQSLKASGNVPEDIVKGYNRYHFSLLHKLRSAAYHADMLTNTLTGTPPLDSLSQSSDFMLKVNMHLDGFFYCGGSALDILAREVLTYFAIPLPANVYFHTAHATLTNARPGDALLPRLTDPAWKRDFSTYRNALTHELMIAGQFTINVNLNGDTEEKTLIIPLPDDPRVDPSERTCRKNQNADEYCKGHMRRLVSLVNTIYGDIAERAHALGRLPL